MVQGFDSLRLLNLDDNCIAEWDEIMKLSQLRWLVKTKCVQFYNTVVTPGGTDAVLTTFDFNNQIYFHVDQTPDLHLPLMI